VALLPFLQVSLPFCKTQPTLSSSLLLCLSGQAPFFPCSDSMTFFYPGLPSSRPRIFLAEGAVLFFPLLAVAELLFFLAGKFVFFLRQARLLPPAPVFIISVLWQPLPVEPMLPWSFSPRPPSLPSFFPVRLLALET